MCVRVRVHACVRMRGCCAHDNGRAARREGALHEPSMFQPTRFFRRAVFMSQHRLLLAVSDSILAVTDMHTHTNTHSFTHTHVTSTHTRVHKQTNNRARMHAPTPMQRAHALNQPPSLTSLLTRMSAAPSDLHTSSLPPYG